MNKLTLFFLVIISFIINSSMFADTQTVSGSASNAAYVRPDNGNPYYTLNSGYSDTHGSYHGGNPPALYTWRTMFVIDLTNYSPYGTVSAADLAIEGTSYNNTTTVYITQMNYQPDAQSIYNGAPQGSYMGSYLTNGQEHEIQNLQALAQNNLGGKIYIGVYASDESSTNSCGVVYIYFDFGYTAPTPVSFTVTNNFTASGGSSGTVTVNSQNYSVPKTYSNITQGTNFALQAVSPQYDNQGNERVWNTSGINLSSWTENSTIRTTSSQYSFTTLSSDNNAIFTANLRPQYNITFQNTFIGAGHGQTISVNNSQYNSPSPVFPVVAQNTIPAAANNSFSVNGIVYYFNNWTDGNGNFISSSNNYTFSPGANTTYNANFIGYPIVSVINMQYNIVVGNPIQMTWTDNPNPNVTYQIWRCIKGGPNPVMIATVGRGVQTYTDQNYIFTGTYTDLLLYYDVRQYYSVEGTYSPQNFVAVYGKYNVKLASQGNSTKSATETETIANYNLEQNSPNPFNPSTIINYQLPKDGFVTLKIYDILGREVKQLVSEFKTQGKYSVRFDASNLTSGIYFYRIKANDFISIKKMILTK